MGVCLSIEEDEIQAPPLGIFPPAGAARFLRTSQEFEIISSQHKRQRTLDSTMDHAQAQKFFSHVPEIT